MHYFAVIFHQLTLELHALNVPTFCFSPSIPDEKGWLPLHTASAHGHNDIVKWLAVEHADLGALTPTGYTALHLAAMNGHTNTMIVC